MAKKNALQAGELNWQQTRFVENYISNGGNATVAYIDAGYSRNGAGQSAFKMLESPTIQLAIEQERQRMANLLNFKREDALRLLLGIATASVDDFAPVVKDYKDRENYKELGAKRHAIKSVEKTKFGTKITLHDKREAINDLWDKLGLGETGSKGNWFDGLDELMQLVRGTKKTE